VAALPSLRLLLAFNTISHQHEIFYMLHGDILPPIAPPAVVDSQLWEGAHWKPPAQPAETQTSQTDDLSSLLAGGSTESGRKRSRQSFGTLSSHSVSPPSDPADQAFPHPAKAQDLLLRRKSSRILALVSSAVKDEAEASPPAPPSGPQAAADSDSVACFVRVCDNVFRQSSTPGRAAAQYGAASSAHLVSSHLSTAVCGSGTGSGGGGTGGGVSLLGVWKGAAADGGDALISVPLMQIPPTMSLSWGAQESRTAPQHLHSALQFAIGPGTRRDATSWRLSFPPNREQTAMFMEQAAPLLAWHSSPLQSSVLAAQSTTGESGPAVALALQQSYVAIDASSCGTAARLPHTALPFFPESSSVVPPLQLEPLASAAWDSLTACAQESSSTVTAWILPDVMVHSTEQDGQEGCSVWRGAVQLCSLPSAPNRGDNTDPRLKLPLAVAQVLQMCLLLLHQNDRAHAEAFICRALLAVEEHGAQGLSRIESRGDQQTGSALSMNINESGSLTPAVAHALLVGCLLRMMLGSPQSREWHVVLSGKQLVVQTNSSIVSNRSRARSGNATILSEAVGRSWSTEVHSSLGTGAACGLGARSSEPSQLAINTVMGCILQLMTGIDNPSCADSEYGESLAAVALPISACSSLGVCTAASWEARRWAGTVMDSVHLQVQGADDFDCAVVGTMPFCALPVFPMWAPHMRACLSSLAQGHATPLPSFADEGATSCVVVPEHAALPVALAGVGPLEALFTSEGAVVSVLRLLAFEAANKLDWPAVQQCLHAELGPHTCARIASVAGHPTTASMLACGSSVGALAVTGVRKGLQFASAVLGHQPSSAFWNGTGNTPSKSGRMSEIAELVPPPKTGDWAGDVTVQGTGTAATGSQPRHQSGGARNLLQRHQDSVGDVHTLLAAASAQASSSMEGDLSADTSRTLVQAALMASAYFPGDRRWEQIAELLDCSQPPLLAQHPALSAGTDHARMEALHAIVARRARRALVSSVGRGALTLGLVALSPEHLLPVQRVTLAARVPPNGTLQNVDMALLGGDAKAILSAGAFHNGVATGLQAATQIISENGGASALRAWVMAHRASDMNPASAGVLLGLGLRGLFKHLRLPDVYQLLRDGNDSSSVACLLGLAASHRGTGNRAASKAMTLLLPRSLPAAAAEFDIHATVQSAAVSSLGLLYAGTGQRSVAEFALHEITSCPCPPSSVDTIASHKDHNELYALAAGWALGAVELPACSEAKLARASAGAHRALPALSRLVRGMAPLGFVPTPLDGIYDSSGGMPVPRVYHEAAQVNPTVVTPAAITAVALMFQRTNNESALRALQLPASLGLLDGLRPDTVLLRSAAASLVAWDCVVPSAIWLQSQVPKIVLTCVQEMVQQAGVGGASSDLMGQLAALMAGGAAAGSADSQAAEAVPLETTDQIAPPDYEESPYDARNNALAEEMGALPRFPFGTLSQVDVQAVSQVYLCSLSGAAWGMGMRFAGTQNLFAAHAILNVLQLLVGVATCGSVANFTSAMRGMGGMQSSQSTADTAVFTNALAGVFALDSSTVRMCLCTVLCSLGMVCCGSADSNAMRAMLAVQTHVADQGAAKPDLDMALSMAMGWLGMSAGRGSFERSPVAIACLWLSSFPHWPASLGDNHLHMQPWRHLYAVAHFNRSLVVPSSIGTDGAATVQLELTSHAAFELGLPAGSCVIMTTPCRLPEADLIKSVRLPLHDDISEKLQPCHWELKHLLHSAVPADESGNALFESAADGFCLQRHTAEAQAYKSMIPPILDAANRAMGGCLRAFSSARWVSSLTSGAESAQLQQASSIVRDAVFASLAGHRFDSIATAVPHILGGSLAAADPSALTSFRMLACCLSPALALHLCIIHRTISMEAEISVKMDTWDAIIAACKLVKASGGSSSYEALEAADEVLLTVSAASQLFE